VVLSRDILAEGEKDKISEAEVHVDSDRKVE
jgi:hypothetical protein